MEIRRFGIRIIMIKLLKHKIAAGAEPAHGDRPESLVMPTVLVRAVVVIVTVNDAAAAPLTLSVVGLMEQAAAVGSPEQVKPTVPEKPFIAATYRL